MEKIPFDKAAFKAGAVVLNPYGEERIFIRDEDGITWVRPPTHHYNTSIPTRDLATWFSMKPQPVDADGWLPVKGDGTIPEQIAGAKAGEWEYRTKDNQNTAMQGGPDCYSAGFDYLKIDSSCQFVAVRLIKKSQDTKVYPACKGKNCGSTDGRTHSEECYAEHEETTRIKSKPVVPPILPIGQNEMLKIAGEAMRDGTKGGGPVVTCDVIARLIK